MSPPAVFFGLSTSRPVIVTSRASVGFGQAVGRRTVIGVGSAPVPMDAIPPSRRSDLELAVRRGERAESLDAPCREAHVTPAAGRDDQAAGRIADGQECGRPEPAGLGCHDAARRDTGTDRQRGPDACESTWRRWSAPGLRAWALGVGVGPRAASRRRVGVAVGVGVGVGVAVGVGVGLAWRSASAWRCGQDRARRRASHGLGSRMVPVPELSRCPSGPVTVAISPPAIVRPASASGPMTVRSGPDPSSIVTPSPSASVVGRPVTVPATVIRAALERFAERTGRHEAMARGRVADSPSRDRRLGDPERALRVTAPSVDPATRIFVPAGHVPTTVASRYSAIPPVASWTKPPWPHSSAPRPSSGRQRCAPTPSAMARAAAIDTGVGVDVGTGWCDAYESCPA